MKRGVAIALVLGALLSGCASSGSGETCQELWAEHRVCPPQKWHEENEGPSTYNHFHSTYGE